MFSAFHVYRNPGIVKILSFMILVQKQGCRPELGKRQIGAKEAPTLIIKHLRREECMLNEADHVAVGDHAVERPQVIESKAKLAKDSLLRKS